MIVQCSKKPFPKLCFAKPGDVVQILGDNGFALPNVYLVAAASKGKAAPLNASNGLYSDERELALIDLQTGIAIDIPCLSSRVRILKNAYLCIEDE